MIAATLVQEVARQFRAAGIADAAQEAEELVRRLLGLSKIAYLSTSPELTAEQEAQVRKSADRRSAGEPLHYIVGFVEFMGLHISVGPGVLIPRPETELLVEETIKIIKSGKSEVGSQKSDDNSSHITHHSSPSFGHSSICNHQSSGITILDLCTGSGCIALSVAQAVPDARVWGVDISPQALTYARSNAQANGIDNITFLEGDLFNPVSGKRFHCITANPPYIRAAEIGGLQVEIREHEPPGALDGGPDGLEYYRRICAAAPLYLQPGGMLIMELGYDQADEVSLLATASGLSDIQCLPDYAGIRRIFFARVPS